MLRCAVCVLWAFAQPCWLTGTPHGCGVVLLPWLRWLCVVIVALQELMSERTKVVVAPLMALLDLSLRFARMQEQLYSRALAEVGLQSRFRSAVEARCV